MTDAPAATFCIFDPHCGTRGASVVGRGFKTKKAAEKRLAELIEKDEPGHVGCIVIPNAELAEYGEQPTMFRSV